MTMRVLVLDRSAAARNALREAVEAAGGIADVVDNPTEAIAHAEMHPPLVAFIDCDWRDDSQTGRAFLRRFREAHRETQIVAMTSPGSEEYTVEGLRLGATNYLTKPVNPALLRHLLERFANLAEAHQRRHRAWNYVTRQHTILKVPSDPHVVTPVVEHIVSRVAEISPTADALGVQLGLEEMLRNAIEHGNLEIGFDAKAGALKNFAFVKLLAERLADPRYADRVVTIEYLYENGTFVCIIEDEGPGFDWHKVRDPLSEEGLVQLNGRGIFLTRTFFDSVTYECRGNRVILVKRLDTDTASDAMPSR